LKEKTKQSIRLAFYDIGKYLTADARKFIDELPKHGRTYKTRLKITGKRLKRVSKGGFMNSHIASAPGEAPAIVTGDLRRSVGFRVRGSDEVEIGAGSAKVNYAKYLEHSDLTEMKDSFKRMKIAPRPFISRAYMTNKQMILYLFQKALKKDLGLK
jgi:hypothetical protein